MQHALPHRRAAEHDDFAKQKRSTLGKIDIDPAQHPRPVEQNRLLRQPGHVPPPAVISMPKRSPPATPPAVLTKTANNPSASGEGKRTRSEPDSWSWPRRVTPSAWRTSNLTAPLPRLAG